MYMSLITLLLMLPLLVHSQSDSARSQRTIVVQAIRPLPAWHPGFALVFQAGTDGLALALGHSISRHLAARLGVSAYYYKGTLNQGNETDNIQMLYRYTEQLMTINLMADVYPFKRAGLRVEYSGI